MSDLQAMVRSLELGALAHILEPDPVLYRLSTLLGDDEERLAEEWLARSIAVLAGLVGPGDAVSDGLARNDWHLLAAARTRPDLEDTECARIDAAWKQACADLVRRKSELASELHNDQDLAAFGADELEEIATLSASVDSVELPADSINDSAAKKLKDAEGVLGEVGEYRLLLREEAIAREEADQRRARDAARRVAVAAVDLLGTHDERGESVLLALPALVRAGDVAKLETLIEQLASGSAIDVPKAARRSLSTSRIRVGVRRRIAPFDVNLSKRTQELLAAAAIAETPVDASEIYKSVRRTTSLQERASLLLGGAASLGSDRPERYSLLADGLLHDALHRLACRQYNQAASALQQAMLCSAWLRTKGKVAPELERRSFTAFVLSSFLPRIVDQQRLKDLFDDLDERVDTPEVLLDEIEQADMGEVVESCWEKLDLPQTEAVFLSQLADTPSGMRWLARLVGRSLSPAVAVRRTERTVRRMSALLSAAGAERIPPDRSASLSDALLPYTSGRYTARMLSQLETALEGIRSDAVGAHTDVREALDAASADLTEALQGDLTVGDRPVMTAKPVSGMVYLNADRSTTVPLDFEIRLGDESSPIGALAVEARIKEPKKDEAPWPIKLRNHRAELGPQEGGALGEARFLLDIDPGTLRRGVGAFDVELFFLDGDVVIEAPKKSSFAVRFQKNRRSPNPFVAGDPLVPDSPVFVGRDDDLDRIKASLMGRTQDNMPLVIGIRRIGKTSLLKRFLDLSEIKRAYVGVFVDLQPMPETKTTADFLVDLANNIRSEASRQAGVSMSLDRKAIRDDPAIGFREFTRQIDDFPQEKRVLVVFDEFEKLIANMDHWERTGEKSPQRGLVEVLPILRSCLHHVSRLSYVVSGTPAIKRAFEGEGRRFYGNTVPVVLERLKEQDVAGLIKKGGSDFDLTPSARNELASSCGYQPYLMQVLLHHLHSRLVTRLHKQRATREDVLHIVRQKLLKDDQFFTDYVDSARNNDNDAVLRAVAAAHQRGSTTAVYVSEDAIAAALERMDNRMSREDLRSRLVSLERPDVGLVEHRRQRWRLVIGMLGTYLHQQQQSPF